jgi:hypothetical protein
MLRGNGESFLTTFLVLPGAGSRGLEFKISIPKIHPMKQSKPSESTTMKIQLIQNQVEIGSIFDMYCVNVK